MDFIFSTALIFCILLPLIFFFTKSKPQNPPTKLPKSYPIIGSFFSLFKNKDRFVQWSSEIVLSTPNLTFTLHRSLGRWFVITADAANVQHVLKSSFHNYEKGDFFKVALRDFLGDGIFNSDGQNWKFQRQVASHEFNSKFNQELLDNCGDLDPWHSRCNAVSNQGFGPRATTLTAVPANLAPAWYWTDMFAGEVLYHSRMLKHECRTTEPESATAFYIPFYAGLAVAKYLFTNYTAKQRDAPCEELLRWVSGQAPWRRSNGSDHFIMLGRMTWDFRRSRDDDWGSSFLNMPSMERVLRLGVERDPWDRREISVPYPTGFHPRSNQELNQWLDFVRSRNRSSLFTFVGGKRKVKGDFRGILQSHCYNESDACRVVDCSGTRCYDGTSEILEAFLASDFCLQPRGDAYTRRSTFDCMLAGSIPVFFWKRSIYEQYEWFLGDEPDRFSVFIDRKDVRNGTSIRRVLEGFSRNEVRKMREKLIRLIPKFVYTNGEDGRRGEDAFDLAVDGVLKRFHLEIGRKEIDDGVESS